MKIKAAIGAIIIVLLLIGVISGFVYMNVTPGYFQGDVCGCDVRYTDKAVMDSKFVELNADGILQCTKDNCPYNLINEMKFLLGFLDYKR